KSVVLERGFPGGELLNTEIVEDYPGFEHILGHELAEKFHLHAVKFGAEFRNGVHVTSVRKREDGLFDSETSEGDIYRSPAVIRNSIVDRIEGDHQDLVQTLKLRNVQTCEERDLAATGVFIFVGFRPNTGILVDHVRHDAMGYLLTDSNMETSVPGLFAAGDLL